MLPSLAFVPEIDVIDCFNILMQDFPENAISVANYFENNYIGRKLPNGSRRAPLYPIRLWNMFTRVGNNQARTNNYVEGWHNAFQTIVSVSHPTLSKLLTVLQREQSLQEATLAKWEAGEVKIASRTMQERNERLQTLVSSYEERETLSHLKGIAKNFNF